MSASRLPVAEKARGGGKAPSEAAQGPPGVHQTPSGTPPPPLPIPRRWSEFVSQLAIVAASRSQTRRAHCPHCPLPRRGTPPS
eukprot:scaffold4238_cov105-Isochrysis_galbana.AAC.1